MHIVREGVVEALTASHRRLGEGGIADLTVLNSWFDVVLALAVTDEVKCRWHGS